MEKITVWGRKNSINVMKVVWACAELGLDFERIDVGGPFGFENMPEYLAVNPNGTVPTLRDGDAILWESNVIVRYLSDQYGQGTLWPRQPGQRWIAEQWMDWQQTRMALHITNMLKHLVRLPENERDPQFAEQSRQLVIGLWPVVDNLLSDRKFIAGGDDLSMGDIPLGCVVYRWYAFPIERPRFPHLEAWYARLQERAAFQTHVMLPLT